MSYKRYWVALAIVIIGSFAVLGGVGRKMISEAPPLPDVYTTDGQLLFTGSSITDGQGVWQSIGGQEIGTVWGHGAYVAPDWSADWLHRESEIPAEHMGDQRRRSQLCRAQSGSAGRIQGSADSRYANQYLRRIAQSRHDRRRSRRRIQAACAPTMPMYLPPAGPSTPFRSGALTNVAKQHQLAAFFWWTSWAASTDRPGSTTTYTNNWPHEPLIANVPTSGAVLWSILSLSVCWPASAAWSGGTHRRRRHSFMAPIRQQIHSWQFKPTPSQRATMKYFFVVVILWGVQILMGILTAHYGVEGHGFYGFPLDQYLPYAVTRTWHLQLAIFWIATSWLATGLYVGPAVSGHEPKYQRLGVNVLFGALILVVGGSLAGEWMGIQQRLGNMWFWFGSQGYEYVDLGRFWQILLFIGLVLWLVLMVAALKPALVRKSEDRRFSRSFSSPALRFRSSIPLD